MARRRTPPVPPNLNPRLNPLPKPQRVVWSSHEARTQEQLVEDALSAAATPAQVVTVLRKHYPSMSAARARTLLARVLERWSRESEQQRASNKAAAERRILADIRAARAEKKWSSVASLEHLLADIQGTKEPLRVNVDVRVAESLQLMIGGMSGDDLERLAAEAEARLLSSPSVVEAEGYEVKVQNGKA